MGRWTSVALVGVLTLGGCGGGDDSAETSPTPAPTATSASTAAASSTATPTPTPAQPSGTPAPEALSRFACTQAADGWKATGFLTNQQKGAVSFQVTVVVGPADGSDQSGRTQSVPNVAADGSVPFTISKIPSAGDGATCHVQVLRTRP